MIKHSDGFQVCRCRLIVRLQIFQKAIALGLAAAVLTGMLQATDMIHPVFDRNDEFFNSSTYGGLVGLASFLLVFRTSQSYARYWEGSNLIHRMMGDWSDAASAIFAFCRHSDADPADIKQFKHVLIRLFSLLNATVLGELEGLEANEEVDEAHMRVLGQKRAFEYELLDVSALDRRTLGIVTRTKHGPATVYHKIQELLVENIKLGVLSIPPPLLTVVFQEMGHGMLMYHEGMQLVHVRFPFPYTATMEMLLLVITIITPVVFCGWTPGIAWPIVFTFILVFAFWSLHFTAAELENPFGDYANDLDMRQSQRDVNARLVTLLQESGMTLPRLAVDIDTAQVSTESTLHHPSTLMNFDSVLRRDGQGKRGTAQKSREEALDASSNDAGSEVITLTSDSTGPPRRSFQLRTPSVSAFMRSARPALRTIHSKGSVDSKAKEEGNVGDLEWSSQGIEPDEGRGTLERRKSPGRVDSSNHTNSDRSWSTSSAESCKVLRGGPECMTASAVRSDNHHEGRVMSTKTWSSEGTSPRAGTSQDAGDQASL